MTALDHLDAPLRMTWFLDDRLAPARQILLAERLVEAGLFELTLTGHPLRCPVLKEILGILAGRGMQVSLVVTADDRDLLPVTGQPPARVLLDLGPSPGDVVPDWRGIEGHVQSLREAGCFPGLQLLPLRSSIRLLPDLFLLATDLAVDQVLLPNVPLTDFAGEDPGPRLLRAEDLESFAGFWERIDPRPPIPSGLVVHDLFLWEILCPGQRRDHYSGCQAGNSLGHLDAAGILYPCSSWNQPLGALFDAALTDLWQGDLRRSIRDDIARQPDACNGCRVYARCLAGCRGLSRAFSSEDDEGRGRDLMCSGRRDL
ncbi:SPASM domain-containing protein [Geothermobacter hydrogeniphilus]|uniref:4Fe4S-binding SPASM domain-containing protein n=1 Tax=Geothermobacter hydrogeniphilus TaxID=1969733 RepID=A0A1X0Y8S2_9BACT|nr:SPASM domain-containing protein [Geothermobacter hydrogeniphilus]ORJ61591.1 hypothetical protein B5V00_06015 [Geothermobacter hydrogeniphilus]